MNNAIKQQVRKAPIWLKVIGVGAVAFVAAPFVFITIKSLVGMMIAAGLAFFGIVFMPILMDWIALKGQQARKAVVGANPIEKLEQLYAQKKEGLRTFYTGLQTFIGKVNGFQSQYTEMVRKYPHRKVELDKQLATLLALKDAKMRAYKKADEQLTIYGQKVEEARDMYNLALAAQAAEQAGGAATDPMDEILEQVAFNTVSDEMNRAFAALEMEMLTDENTTFATEKVVLGASSTPALTEQTPLQIEAKPVSKTIERVK